MNLILDWGYESDALYDLVWNGEWILDKMMEILNAKSRKTVYPAYYEADRKQKRKYFMYHPKDCTLYAAVLPLVEKNQIFFDSFV